jgi:hypothetical protein
MKRVLSIIAWAAGAFFATAIAFRFACIVLVNFLPLVVATADTALRLVRCVGILLPFAAAAIVVRLGMRGRLAGTKRGGESAIAMADPSIPPLL